MNKETQFKRIKIYPLSILSEFTSFEKSNEVKELEGLFIRTYSLRHILFMQNSNCVVCGLKGKFIALEQLEDPTVLINNQGQLNMYGINKKGKEVLFTKDHTFPYCKGGPTHLDNLTTMCIDCNKKKSFQLDIELLKTKEFSLEEILIRMNKEFDHILIENFNLKSQLSRLGRLLNLSNNLRKICLNNGIDIQKELLELKGQAKINNEIVGTSVEIEEALYQKII